MQEDRNISSKISLFSDDRFGELRAFECDNEPWFVAADVCKALDHSNVSMALARLDDDEKGKFNLGLPGGGTNAVNFPGLLSLILGSRKPEAREYKRWVTHEVLPAIHKTGGYMVAREDETPMETVSRALLIAKDALDRKDARITQLEADGIMKDAEIARIAPKAAFTDGVLDADGTYTVTEAARLLKQVDHSMGQKKLFGLLRADAMLEKHSNKATSLAVERGYLYNFIPKPYEDPLTGEKKLREPYARVTSKGLKWMNQRYCKPNGQTALEVVA